jgi:hypothetical protein
MAPLLILALTGFTSTVLPYSKTSADDLSPPGWSHREVLRLGRDFGDADFKVAIDSWVSTSTPDEIAELRFWWVNADLDDERSPFGSKLRQHIGLEFVENDPDDWTVKLQGNRKEFVFDVELGPSGDVAAYANIVTDTGVVEHCRVEKGTFVARRLLGIPIGLKQLSIACVSPDGTAHRGVLPYRKLKRGSIYQP